MNKSLLALSLVKKATTDISGVTSTSTGIDYQDLALNIFLKFIDVIEGAIIIAVGMFAIKLLRRYLAKVEVTHERQRTALNLLEKISTGFVFVISITLGLKIIGLDLTLLVSVMTLGLSFGLGDVVKNYIAGLLILFKSPFEIGDVVTIRSFTGKVEKIEFQSVTMRTFDQKVVTIQNSDLLTQSIVNFSKSAQSRLEINIPLGYGSDVRRAVLIFDKILQNNPVILKAPKYSIVVKTFAERGINILLRFWVQKPCNVLKIRSDLAVQIQEAFDEEKIFAPYSRESGLNDLYGMTAARKERLTAFYGQPILADIAGQTISQIAAAAPVAAEEYGDADEPE
ncbi:mechanosensitive ion channel [Candidatus Peregrinibacteria bacterium]|nr:mechanosensitive ion channel [Candidatus Peregrinibacteria bacterium]